MNRLYGLFSIEAEKSPVKLKLKSFSYCQRQILPLNEWMDGLFIGNLNYNAGGG